MPDIYSEAGADAAFEPIRTTASQAEAEAGTATTVLAWTPERVKQAIDALAPAGGGGTPDDDSVSTAKIQDGAVTKAKTDAGVQASLDAADGAVPDTRTVAGKALSSNVTLDADDISDATTVGKSLIRAADAATAKAAVGLTNVPNVDTTDASNITTGTLPASVMPPLAINETFTVADEAAMLALTAQRGDVAIRTDLAPSMLILTTDDPTVVGNWQLMVTAADALAADNVTRLDAIDDILADPINYDRLPVGTTVTYDTDRDNAGNLPGSRPTSRQDITIVWVHDTDPGALLGNYDHWIQVP